MTLDQLTTSFTTLFVILDPPGLGPIFIGLTQGMTTAERRSVAVRASLIAFGILAGAAVAGDWLLRQLGIGLPAFRIAGGLLLFAIAFEMVFERRTDRKQKTAETAVTIDHVRSVAAFPLGIPLMAGPGAITAIILLAGRTDANLLSMAALLLVLAVVIASCTLIFLVAGKVDRLLGITGNILLQRLLGVLLSALAVQFVVDGVKAVM